MAKTKKEETIPKNKKNSRRNIRKIIKSVDLSELTRIALKNERDRKNRFEIREEIVRNLLQGFLLYYYLCGLFEC